MSLPVLHTRVDKSPTGSGTLPAESERKEGQASRLYDRVSADCPDAHPPTATRQPRLSKNGSLEMPRPIRGKRRLACPAAALPPRLPQHSLGRKKPHTCTALYVRPSASFIQPDVRVVEG